MLFEDLLAYVMLSLFEKITLHLITILMITMQFQVILLYDLHVLCIIKANLSLLCLEVAITTSIISLILLLNPFYLNLEEEYTVMAMVMAHI